jgi:ribosomal protein S1
VLKVDVKEQRISLSRKKLLPNPWTTVEERYAVNQLVEGTITRIVDYGAFTEVEPGVEGLLHVSQLSRGNVENTSDVVNVNEKHLLRIVSIDTDRQRIGLSLKAVTAQEQIEWMAQQDVEDDKTQEDQSIDVVAVDEAAIVEESQSPEDQSVDVAAVDEVAVAEDDQSPEDQSVDVAAVDEAAVIEEDKTQEDQSVDVAAVEEAAAMVDESAANETSSEE